MVGECFAPIITLAAEDEWAFSCPLDYGPALGADANFVNTATQH